LAVGEILKSEFCAGPQSGAKAVGQIEEKGKHGEMARVAVSLLPAPWIRALTDG